MSDMLSQDEINALLGSQDSDANSADDYQLSKDEIDILGEVGNISMGSSATSLSALLSQKVLITTPEVGVSKWTEVAKDYDRPCVGIRVAYTEGIDGTNILMLKQQDVKMITALMMGGNGEGVDVDEPLSEIDMSAIAECMNQMVGASSTSLSTIIGEKVDIGTPKSFVLDLSDEELIESIGFADQMFACIKFRMQIGNLIDSEIVSLMPFEFAKDLSIQFSDKFSQNDNQVTNDDSSVSKTKIEEPNQQQSNSQYETNQGYTQNLQPQNNQNLQYQSQAQYNPNPQPQYNAQPVQFQNFNFAELEQQKENIEIIMDVPLEVTVELGRTSKKIKEILEFSPGSIIELNKLAGEPIDVLVNGKFIAKGEVVVIDENFGIRITSIINTELRI